MATSKWTKINRRRTEPLALQHTGWRFIWLTESYLSRLRSFYFVFCRNTEPTWLLPVASCNAASPHQHPPPQWIKKNAGGEKEVCWRMRRHGSPLRFSEESGVTSRARPPCRSLRESPSTHAATSTGRRWGSGRKTRFPFLRWPGMS